MFVDTGLTIVFISRMSYKKKLSKAIEVWGKIDEGRC